MPKELKAAAEQLRELEKLVKKITRKSLKDSTLDTVVQISLSNIEPGQVKYSAQISSPAKGVQPITFSFNTFKDLHAALTAAEKEIDKTQVELVFHQNMINSLESRIKAHKERVEEINNGDTEDEDIELEDV